MFDTITRVSLGRDSHGRTLITVTGTRIEGEAVKREYRTDTHGDGLWLWSAPDWHQQAGTGQFGVHCTAATLRRRVRRLLLRPDC